MLKEDFVIATAIAIGVQTVLEQGTWMRRRRRLMHVNDIPDQLTTESIY